MSNVQNNINSNDQDVKIVVALLMSAATPAMVFTIWAYYWMMSYDYFDSKIEMAGWAIVLGGVAFIIAFAHLLVFGFPLFRLGLHLKIVRWWSTLTGAFIVGCTPCATLMLITGGLPPEPSGFIYSIMILGLFGMSGGATFWLLWRYWVFKDRDKTPNANS